MSLTVIVKEPTANSYVQEWMGKEYNVEVQFVGMTLRDWERNGYHDSDFYATVYDTEKCAFREILHQTTRAGMFPHNVIVDASPAVRDLWEAYRDGNKKREIRRIKEAQIATLKKGALTDETIENWFKAFPVTSIYGRDDGSDLLRAFLATKPRKEFRKSLKNQIIDWLNTPAEERRFNWPLSPRQMRCIQPYRPY